jgi:hypothetical protein
MSDAKNFSSSLQRTDEKICTAEELPALIPLNVTTIGADLYEDANKSGYSNNWILDGWSAEVWPDGTVECFRLSLTT